MLKKDNNVWKENAPEQTPEQTPEYTFREIVNVGIRKSKFKRILALLCAVVIFLTVNTLRQYGNTLERYPMCNLEEHVHGEECYDAEGNLVCGLEEHVHTDACYQQAPVKPEPTVLDEFVDLNSQVVLASPMDGESGASSNLEGPVGEVEVNLGDEEDNGLTVENENPPSGEEAGPEEPEYDLNGSDVALLSDVLNAVKASVSGINLAGELQDSVVSAEGEHITVEPIEGAENEYVIRVTKDFARIELCVIGDEVFTLYLTNGVAVEQTAPVGETTLVEENVEQTIEKPVEPVVEDTAPVKQDDNTNETLGNENEITETESKQTEVEAEQTEVGAFEEPITSIGDEPAAGETTSDQAVTGETTVNENVTDEDTDDRSLADEVYEGGVEAEYAQAEPARVALDFTNYIATEDHAAFLYDDELNAVLVKVGEIASVDGVEVSLSEIPGEDEIEDEETLFITGNGEYELGRTLYQVSGLKLAAPAAPAAPVEEKEADATSDVKETADGQEADAPSDGEKVADEEEAADGQEADAPSDGEKVADGEEAANGQEADAPSDGEKVADEQETDVPSDGEKVTDGEKAVDGQEADAPSDGEKAADGEVAADGQDADAPSDGEKVTDDEKVADGQEADAPSDGEKTIDGEKVADGQEADAPSDGQVTASDDDTETADGQSDMGAADEGAPSENALSITVDLSEVEAYPISLRALMTQAELPEAETVEELPASEWKIEYDEALLTVEASEEDYLVSPLASIEQTEIIVDNGSRYVLTLVNCTLPEAEEAPADDDTEEPAATERAATIDLSECAEYPLSLRALMTQAELPGAETVEENEEEIVEETVEELPASEWKIEYDDGLLAVEAAEEDYFVSPLASFEQTQITVDNGSRYALTLMNCALDAAEAPEIAYPAQHFEGSTATMKVTVDAPEGAFPEGTTMTLADIEDEQTLSDIEDTVSDEFVAVRRVHAVDITFFNADGEEIEPLVPISVQMTVAEIEESQAAVVVHVDSEGNSEVVETQGDATEGEALKNEAPKGETELSVEMPATTAEPPAPEGTDVTIEADSFSVYAVVVTEVIETRYIDAQGHTYEIRVGYGQDAGIPAGATLAVRELTGEAAEAYLTQTEEALQGRETITLARFFDITILDAEGNEVQPATPVEVRATLADGTDDTVKAVHFDEKDGLEVLSAEKDEDEAVCFDAASFSVYGIVYTVDFHWEADGKMYEFTLPGGGFLSFQKLVEMLGINNTTDNEGNEAENNADNTENEADSEARPSGEMPDVDNRDVTALTLENVVVSDATRAFVADVERVEFSSPSLVDVSRVENTATVGEIKENRGLEIQYSAELTEEQIAGINETIVESGDWALISMLPFDSEETLTVTMKNGDAFEIRVTDAQIRTTVIDAKGETWEITVTYDDSAEIPDGAKLEASEILPDSELYEAYVSRTENALGMDEGSAEYIRLFDIKIVDKDDPSVKYQPAEGATVDVRVELADSTGEDMSVVHFSDVEDSGLVIKAETENGETRFETDGFSVYAIVSGPSGAEAGWVRLTSLDRLTSKGFFIGHTSGYYLTNTAASKVSGENTINGIKRVGKSAVPTVNGAVLYYFENASDGKYYIYCMDGENKKYVVNNGDANLSFANDEGDKTPFTVEVNGSGVFKIHNEGWYWNMQTGAGDGFYSKYSKNDGNNNLYLWEETDPTKDTYGLDGKSYGLMTWTGGKTAKALMAVENSGMDENNEPYSGCLEAKFLTVMVQETNTGNKLYVPNDTTDTVTMWTFEWDHNDANNRANSYYYLKANNGKYLKITADGLHLADEKDAACLIQVKPGTGNNEGQVCLKSVDTGSKTLTYSGKYAKGYSIGGVAGSEWLYLVEPKAEQELATYEKVYTATKISVSDPGLTTGDKIVIYARQWKDDHYEYYAINSEGELVPCIESGNTIEWYGGNVNNMLWQFTEYVYEGTDTPNGYYELENLYARSKGEPSYLAPKYSDGTILSDKTVGVLLQGRTDKQYYSPIVAWDTPEYMYSALTVDLNQADPVLEPCYRVDGLDLYFAKMEDIPVDDVLHTVPTVDNDQYGIVMKMVDLGNGKDTEDMTGQMNNFLQFGIKNGKTWEHTPGLLSTNLTDGYPTTMRENSGGWLKDLYDGEQAVNHLFIDSTYRATGYFEYNSAQNFASLHDGNFVVYQELGSNDTTKKDTLQHGQFFPYNDIEAGRFTSVNRENLYTATADPLPESDPRKHEQLYLVKGTTDYYFAMELEASFVQTPSGLDAWGHDIIFEFSGDDDFWLYVDDELVIDLGGIHSAVTGTVNFRTGEVVLNPKSTEHGRTTTLLDLFAENYLARGLAPNLEAAKELVQSKFEQNDAGQWVFKDNTKHTMRIFYMERGAGASNLHMKFNLASVKKGTVELNKKLEGASKTDTSNAVFPYQVFYRMENENSSDPERMLRNAFDPSEASDGYYNVFGTSESTNYVFYKDKTKPVTFLPELTVGGVTYYNVFMLKPDETAVLNFPVTRPDPDFDAITVGEYRIVECGIDPTVFSRVTVNGDVINGAPNTNNGNISDYAIGMASTDDRPTVDYVNKVENLKNLTFTKELYRKIDADKGLVKVNPDGTEIADGDVPASQVATDVTFDFRLYFKTSYDDDYVPANLHIYHVKDPEGYYCAWNSETGCFERITNEKYPGYLESGYENGTTDYTKLTDDVVGSNGSVTHRGKFFASFETSPNGSIASIPAYYTIEVRDCIPGTKYKLVERPTEMPDGYKFWKYANNENPEHVDPDDPWDGIEGTIATNADAWAVVKNYMGYGFRLEKVWEDASAMQGRDPAYFALYTIDADGKPELVPNSVRKLDYDADPQTLYWWYLTLPIADTDLDDYAVFEVQLTGDGITDANDGVVSGYDSIKPISAGGVLTLNGTRKGQDEPEEIKYTVTYAEPEQIGDNVMAFKATNSPAQLPPVRFVKTDWNGVPLPGAKFSLRFGENLASSLFDPAMKTSDDNGLIAQVYLQENVVYTLMEHHSPQGYVGIDGPLTVTLVATTSSGWELIVNPEIQPGKPAYYTVTTENGILTLTVKNHPYKMQVVKVDSTDPTMKVEGAVFDLYKQVTIGSQSTWDEENPVYKDLETDENGVIPLGETLPAGTYQLREKEAPYGYFAVGNINFTVGETGVIVLGDHPDGVSLTQEQTTLADNTSFINYTIVVPDPPYPLKLKKEDDSRNELTGAKFKLEQHQESAVEWVDVKDIDMTSESEFDLGALPLGFYRLEETDAPEGYVLLNRYVYFKIQLETTDNAGEEKPKRIVELTDENGTGTNANTNASLVEPDDDNNVYTIVVQNIPGSSLPATGGPGTGLFTLLGGLTILLAGTGLFLSQRKRREARG